MAKLIPSHATTAQLTIQDVGAGEEDVELDGLRVKERFRGRDDTEMVV